MVRWEPSQCFGHLWYRRCFGAGLLLLLEKPIGKRRLCSGAGILFGFVLLAISLNHSPRGLLALMLLSAPHDHGGHRGQLNSPAKCPWRISRASGSPLYDFHARGLAAGNLLAGILVTPMGILPYLGWSGGAAVILQLLTAFFWRRIHQQTSPKSSMQILQEP